MKVTRAFRYMLLTLCDLWWSMVFCKRWSK